MRRASHPIVQAFSLIAQPASLAVGRELIGESAREAGFSEERVFDIRVACSEAIANAIEHAPVKNHIEITVSLYRDRLEVQVEDPGEFQAPYRPDLRPHRGLGLPLMAKLADHLALYSGPRGGTLVSLTFYRPGGEREETDILPPSIRKLVEENELFAAITDNAPVGIYLLSPDLRFRWANQTYLAFLDEPYRSGDLVGSYFADVVPGAREAGLIAGLQEASKTGKQVRFEEQELSGFSRGTTWWRRTVVPLKEDEGVGPYDLLVVVSDETEQMRTQEALRESQKDLDRAQEVGQIGWWRLDTRTDVLIWSDENYRIFGVPKGTPLSYESFLETIHPDDRVYVDEQWNASLRREPYDVEHRVMSEGQLKWVREKAYLEFDDGGRPLGGFGITQDITERKRAEAALLENDERLKFALDASHIGAWDLDLADHTAHRSPGHDLIFGYESMLPEWTYEMFLSHVVPAHQADVDERFQRAVAARTDWGFECQIRRADGESRWIWAAGRHRPNNAGGWRMAGVVQDITERRQAEEALRLSLERQALAQRAAKSGFWDWDVVSGNLSWSPELFDLLGLDPAFEPTFDVWLSVIHPEDRERALGTSNRSIEEGMALDQEYRIRLPGGQERWIGALGDTTYSSDGQPLRMSGICMDVTERKRAEEMLREDEERFRTMANAIPQLAWMANADGYIYWYNRRWYEYTGTSLAEMEGWGWQSVHDPDVLPAVLARWKESIASGQPFDMEFPLRGADGQFRPFLTRVMPLRDAAGRVIQWFGTNTDMTERKRAEEARRKDEESLAKTLSFVGRLRLFERRKAWLVLPIGVVCQVALFLGVDQLGSPSRYLGIPGAAAALVGVLAAIIGGPTPGMAVALAGGAAYFVFLTDFGRSVAWPAIVVSILLWTLAAAVAGLAGDWVRRNATQREMLLANMLGERETLADSLGVANTGLAARNEELQGAHQEIARLFDEQSSLVIALQQALLDIPQDLPGVKFAHLYQSATRHAQVGGDFYDVFEAKHGRVGLLIGDVSGHGVEAARIATLVKDTIHAFAHQFRLPHLVLRETNRLLVEKNLPEFVTVFLGFLDREGGRLVYSSAGHPPPLLATDGQVALLQSIGVPLGVFADARYRDTETDVQEGSLLLLYTDGITEARRDGDFFGEKRLVEALRGVRSGPIDALPSLLLDEAIGFSGGLLRDDVALLVVEYLGMTGDLGRPSERE